MTEKYTKKKHLPLNVASEQSWEQYHQKERRYHNTNANWKQTMAELPNSELQKLMFMYALEGNKKMLKFLVGNTNVDVNMVDCDGNTPLMFAVKSGQKEAIEYLLQKGAKINYINDMGFSPLHLAVRKNSLTLAGLLLEYGADVNFEDKYNQTPIFDAVQEDNGNMIDFLVLNGAKINQRNKNGRTPLMVSAFDKMRQVAMCKLLNNNANVLVGDLDGKTALMHAINNNNGKMIDILLKAGSDVNHHDKYGNTPLMICAKRGNREAIRVLVGVGACPIDENIDGQTAQDIAKACNNNGSAEILAKAEKIYRSNITKEQKQEALQSFLTHNHHPNSCQR